MQGEMRLDKLRWKQKNVDATVRAQREGVGIIVVESKLQPPWKRGEEGSLSLDFGGHKLNGKAECVTCIQHPVGGGLWRWVSEFRWLAEPKRTVPRRKA